MKEIMKNITKLRKAHGLNQEKFAEKIGVSRETIRNWEGGKSTPRGRNLKTICDVFNVTLEELSEKQPFEEEAKIKMAIDELKTDLREDLRTNLKADIKEDLRTDLKTDIKEDLRTDLKTDIKEDLRTDLKADIKEDLRTDLEANIKEDLRTDLKTDIKEDLKTDLKTDIKKDLRVDLKTDIKEEQAKSHKAIKVSIIKKVRNIILILLICTSIIYVGCSGYKFTILTQIGEKVAKYENLDNYYCEIQTYKDGYLREKEEILYKDQIYKIEKIIYNDAGQIVAKTLKKLDLKNNIQTINNNGSYKVDWEIPNKEKYENGKYMYNSFPIEIQNDIKNKMENSLRINLLKTKNVNSNTYRLSINSLKVELNKETYSPVFYSNGEIGSNIKKYYKIELNNVENKDLEV